MAIYRKYSATAGNDLFVLHRCSQCSSVNVSDQRVSTSWAYDDRGALFSSQMERRKNNAQNTATNNLNELMEQIYNEASRRRYNTARLNCQCATCGHREPWAKLRFPIAMNIASTGRLLAIVVGIFTITGLLGGQVVEEFPMWLLGWVCVLSIWLLPTAYMSIMRSKRNKEIDKMDYANLPRITTSESHLKEMVEKMCETAT